MVRIFILISFFLTGIFAFGQENPESKTGSWIIYNQNTKLSGKWSLFTDIQLRNYRLADDQSNWLLRQGVTYHIQPAVSVTAGYAFITYHPFDADGEQNNFPGTKEHRAWQQLQLLQKWNKISLQHRYRSEQRWLNPATGEPVYQNRFRYRIHFQKLLADSKSRLYLAAYNEIFIALTPAPFDQNRLYGGAGIHVLKNTRVEAGFLLQSFPQSVHYKRIAISVLTDLQAFR